MDTLDIRIIDGMRLNPRIAAKSLARDLGVTEQTVSARIRSLRDRDQLRVVVQSDIYARGFEFVCFADIYVAGRAAVVVAEELTAIEGISAVVLTIGHPEIIAMFNACDRQDFLRIVNDGIGKVDGVEHVETLISMEIAKYQSEYARLRDN